MKRLDLILQLWHTVRIFFQAYLKEASMGRAVSRVRSARRRIGKAREVKTKRASSLKPIVRFHSAWLEIVWLLVLSFSPLDSVGTTLVWVFVPKTTDKNQQPLWLDPVDNKACLGYCMGFLWCLSKRQVHYVQGFLISSVFSVFNSQSGIPEVSESHSKIYL